MANKNKTTKEKKKKKSRNHSPRSVASDSSSYLSPLYFPDIKKEIKGERERLLAFSTMEAQDHSYLPPIKASKFLS